MERMMSKRDVIVSRGIIWYMMTLVSLLGLAISINLLWPKHDPSKSRFFKHCAVSATTFYAVMLFRYLFFAQPRSYFTILMESIPHPWNLFLMSPLEKLRQFLISLISACATLVAIFSPLMYKENMQEYDVSVSLFTISLFTGGIGLLQLSDKLRMGPGHAWRTLFVGWLLSLSVMYICLSYDINTVRQALRVGSPWLSASITIFYVLHIYIQKARRQALRGG